MCINLSPFLCHCYCPFFNLNALIVQANSHYFTWLLMFVICLFNASNDWSIVGFKMLVESKICL